MKRMTQALAMLALLWGGGAGAHELGFAGLLSKNNREELAPITLAAGKPVAAAPYVLKSGTYYKLKIQADGSAELGLSGGDFFRAIWINEVVINKVEIRPMGLHSIEFDAAGEAEISFVAITPGSFVLAIPGSQGESQRATFTIQ